MALGTITGSTANSVIAAKIEWEAVADVTTNSSTVTANLYLRRTNSYAGTATGGTNNFKLQIGDAAFENNGEAFSIPNDNTWALACQGTAVILHGADGSKTISIKASGSLPPSSVKWVDCEADVALDTISRGSRIESFTSDNGCLDGELKVCFKQDSILQGCYHILRALDGESELHVEKLNSLYFTPEFSFTLPTPLLEQIYEGHTETDKVTITVELTTYEDEACEKQVGIKDTAELELAMPEDEVKPTLEVTVEPVWPEWPAGKGLEEDAYSWGRYICDKTGICVTVKPVTQYKAGIDSIVLTVDGEEVQFDDGGYQYKSDDVLTKTGEIELSCILADSRGYTTEYTKKVTVGAYSDPKLTVTLCCRCNSDGDPDSEGQFLLVEAVVEHTAFEGYIDDDNPCELILKLSDADHVLLRTVTQEQGTCRYKGVATDIDSEESMILDAQKSYHVQLIARDQLGEDYVMTFLIPTAKVQCHEGDGFLALGQYADPGQKGVDIAADWPVRIRGDIYLGDGTTTLEEYIRNIMNGG